MLLIAFLFLNSNILCASSNSQSADEPQIQGSETIVCPGTSVTLSIDQIAYDINSNAEWKWYTGSCGGAYVGTGASILVTPYTTLTYFARGEGGTAPNGPCNSVGFEVSVVPSSVITPSCIKVIEQTVTRFSCQEYNFHYKLKNMSPCNLSVNYFGYALRVDLSAVSGLSYSISSSMLSEIDLSIPSSPVFEINTDWFSCEILDVFFTVTVPCSINGNFPSTLYLSCPVAPFTMDCSAQPNANFTMLPPQITVQPVPPSWYNVGDYGTRKFIIKNTESQVNFDGTIAITNFDECDIIEGSYWFKKPSGGESTHTTIGPFPATVILDGSIYYDLLNHNYLAPGESIELITDFNVSSCSINNCDATYTFEVECMNESCFLITKQSNINVNPAQPTISVTLGEINNTNPCVNSGNGLATFIYKNTGIDFAPPIPAGNASLTDLKIYLSWNTEISSPIFNSLKLNGVSLEILLGANFSNMFHVDINLSVPNIPTYVLDFSILPVNLVPVGCGLVDLDGDGNGDDLQTNQEFELSIEYNLMSPSGFDQCDDNKNYLILGSREYFRNQCGLNATPDLSSISSYSLGLTYQSQIGTASMDVNPKDILGSGPLTARICPGSDQIWSVPPFTFNGDGSFPNYEIRIELPARYHLPISPVNIPLTQDMGFPNFIATAIEIPGFVIIQIPNNNPGPGLGVSTSASSFQTAHISCFDLSLVLNCLETDETENASGAAPDVFKFRYVYKMDNNGCEDILSCASDQIFRHCPGDCVSPIGTDPDFTFKRHTLGWKNPMTPGVAPAGQNYFTYTDLLSSTSFVDPTSDIHLDRAYPQDVIRAYATGTLSEDIVHYDAVYFSIFYTPVGNTNIFELVSGNITAEVSSGSNLFQVESNPSFHAPVPPSDLCEFRFKIDPNSSNYNNILGGSLHAEIFLKVLPNIPDYNTVIGTVRANFQAETNLNDPPAIPDTDPELFFTEPGIYSSCDPYSASPSFNVLKPSSYVEIPQVSTFCDETVITCQLKITPARISLLEEDFPNEFRPYSEIGSRLEYNIPTGFEYVVGSAKFNTRIHPSVSSGNGFGAPFQSDVLSVTPNAILSTPNLLVFDGLDGVPLSEWPLMDLGYLGASSLAQSITFKLKPTCQAEDVSIACVEHSQTDYVQQLVNSNLLTTTSLACSSPWSTSGAYQTILHSNPSLEVFELGTASSTGNTIKFTLTVCNINTVAAPNAWISVQLPVQSLNFGTAVSLNPNDFSILSSLTVSTVGNIFYIHLGDLPSAPNGCIIVRLTATLEQPCVNFTTLQSLLVSYGYGCDGYPNLTPPINTTCVNGDPLSTTFDIEPSGLTLNLYPGSNVLNPVYSCDPITLSFLIANPVPGDILNPAFYISLPNGVGFMPSGATSLEIYDPHDSPSPTNITTPPNELLSNGFLAWNLGNSLVGQHQIRVDVTLLLSCDYNPNDFIVYHVRGFRNCGEEVDLQFQFRPLIIGARRADQIVVSSSITESELDCINSSIVTLHLDNVGPALANTNYVELEIPNIFTPSNFSLTQIGLEQVGSTTTTYVFDIGTIPSGGTNFTFEIQLNQTTSPCIIDVPNFRYNVFYTFTAFCSSTVTCTTMNLHSPDQFIVLDACCDCSQYQFTLTPTADPTCFGELGIVNVNVSNPVVGPYNFSWTGPTVIPNSIGASASANGLSLGSYTISATDQFNCFATAPFIITAQPQINAYVVNDVSICIGGSTNLGASPVSGNTYFWSPATGLNDHQVSDPIASPNTTTTYTLIETDPVGCLNSNVVTVTVNPLPIVTASASVPAVCLGDGVFLSGGGASTYVWTGGVFDGIPFNPSSTSTYTVTGTDANLCTATASVSVIVNPLPFANVGSPIQICLGASGIIGASGTSGHSYSWSPSSSLDDYQLPNPTASPIITTTYTLIETDLNGCMNSNSVTVTVNQLPAANAGSSVTICSGLSVSLGAPQIPGNIYSWYPIDYLDDPLISNPISTPQIGIVYILTETNTLTTCSNSNYVIITVHQSPTPNAGNDVSICEGFSAALGSTSISGSSYSWNPTTFLSNSNISNPTASPSSNTSYILTETITSSSCTGTDEVIVTVFPTPSIVVNESYEDLNCLVIPTLTASGALTYSWSPTAGLNPSTGPVVTANPSSTTTYTVTGTSIYGCSSNASIEVNGIYDDICSIGSTNPSGTPQYYVSNTDCYDHSSQWGSNISGIVKPNCSHQTTAVGNFAINGTFYVDNPFTFTNMVLQMGPSSKIIIEPGASLYLDNCVLLACQMDPWVMWDGIYISDHASLSTSNSCIYDAINAVVSQDGGIYDLDNTLFDYNYKCVVVNAFNDSHPGTISGCTFQNSGTLRPNLMGINATRCVVGVEVNDVKSITIGNVLNTCQSVTQISNDFNGVVNGIVLNRSNASIFGNVFRNIIEDPNSWPLVYQDCCYNDPSCSPACDLQLTGRAIWDSGTPHSSDNYLEVGKNGYCNNFLHCSFGVWSENNKSRKITVNHNYFSQISSGVVMSNCNYAKINVENNTMMDFSLGTNRKGIRIAHCQTGNGLSIKNNDINWEFSSGWAHAGISIENSLRDNSFIPQYPPAREISSNRISHTFSGILSSYSNALDICSNRILYSNGDAFSNSHIKRGIYLLSSPSYNLVRDNEVGVYENGTYANVSEVGNLMGIMLHQNKSQELRCNYILNTGSGIFVFKHNEGTKMKANSMSQAYYGVKLANAVIGNQGSGSFPWNNIWYNNPNPLTYRIEGNVSQTTEWPTVTAINGAADNTNTNVTGGFLISNALPPGYSCPASCVSIGSSTSHESSIGHLKADFSPALREELIGTIVRGSRSYSQDPILNHYYDKQYAFRVLLDEEDLKIMDTEDDSLYENFYQEVLNSGIGKMEMIRQLISQEKFNDAITALEDLSPENEIEENFRAVNLIYLKTVANEITFFEEDQFAVLENIAYKDVFESGDAVVLARILLGINPEDDGASARKARPQTIEQSSEQIVINRFSDIYPNPNTGKFQMDYTLGERENATFYLYDVLGKERMQKKLNTENSTLYLEASDLKNGVYIYKLSVNGLTQKNGRIIIMK